MEDVARRAPGSPIAIPAWACYDVLTAAIGARVGILFYDIDPATLAPSMESLVRVGGYRPAGVVVVHPFGIPMDIAAVRAALPSGTLVIEDAAQAWAAHDTTARAGSAGDYTILSFGRGKGITGGSGGALVVRGTHVPAPFAGRRSAGLRDLITCLAMKSLGHPLVYGVPAALPWLRLGETRFHPPHAVLPMTRASAAIVLASVPSADAAAGRRRERAHLLRGAVERSAFLTNIHCRAELQPSWLRVPVLARDEAARDRCVQRGRRLGVASSYPQPLPALARDLDLGIGATSEEEGAEEVARRLLTLPTHDHVSVQDHEGLTALISDP